MKPKYQMPEGKASYKPQDAEKGYQSVPKTRKTNDSDQFNNNITRVGDYPTWDIAELK